MADTMPDNTIDDSFEIAQDLLDFSTSDQGEIIFKWIDKYMQILRTVTNRCRKLADLLDATVAQHAEESEKAKQQYEKKLNEMKDEITVHLTSVNDLKIKNRTKAAACERLEYALRSIHGQIEDLLVPVDVMEQENDGDLVPSEHDNIGNGNGDGDDTDNDDVEEIQNDVEQLNGDALPDTPMLEQHDIYQDENGDGDGDVEMSTADDGTNENDAGENGNKENVQPENAASSSLSSTVPLHSTPICQPLVDNSNTKQAAKQCFKCVETFVQESAYLDHLSHFHGIPITKPGQFVLHPSKKRKVMTPVGDNAMDENGNSRIPKRKNKKTQSSTQASAN